MGADLVAPKFDVELFIRGVNGVRKGLPGLLLLLLLPPALLLGRRVYST